MRRFSLLALLLAGGYAVAADKADPEAAKEALKQLQGVYTVQYAEHEGEKAPPEALKDIKSVTIKGDRFTIHTGSRKDMTVIIHLDPTQKPAHFDIQPTEGPEKEKRFPGIYKLENDILTVCVLDGGGKNRPKEFATTRENHFTLYILKRSKE